MIIQELYRRACETPSDINEHLPRLKVLASLCDKVVELGVRSGVSTTALLAGLDERVKVGPRPFRQLHSFDIADCRNPLLQALADDPHNVEWIFTRGDSREIDIPPCELLFIDTLHNGEQLAAELERHHDHVAKWIVLHDTETFGQTGETSPNGLVPALVEFLTYHEEWKFINHIRQNNGLTVLERCA